MVEGSFRTRAYLVRLLSTVLIGFFDQYVLWRVNGKMQRVGI
jgi:hypothetical protein